eukprot:gene2546-742_t
MGLSTLATLVRTAGLKETLSGKTKYTLLAPNDAAFKKIDKGKLKALMADKKELSKFLLLHVIKGKVPSSALKDNHFVSSMESSKLRVNLFMHRRVVTFNGARVVIGNKGASNGIIHVIDSILQVPKTTGEKLLAGIRKVSLFRKALVMNNVTIPAGSTVFAPTNKAFNNIDASVFSRLLRSPNCMKNLLLNHILPEPVFTTIIDKGSFGLRTKEGTAYMMRKTNETVMVGKALFLQNDILAKDAVIHIIDSVLVPTSALTVLEIARKGGAHIFTNLIKEAGLKPLMTENGKYTIFAPSDAAMQKFIGNSTTDTLQNITDIIKFHIVPRSLQTCDFENDMLLDTLDGKNKIRINVYDYGTNNAVQGVCLKSSKCNIEACNGAVHVVSEVLRPASQTLFDIISTDKRFNAFAAAIQKAKLENTLKGKGPVTIFAPTNAAFTKLKPASLEKILGDEKRLKDLLKYHLIHGTYFRCAFSNDCPMTAMNGGSVLVSKNNDIIQVNGGKAVAKELVASNGIIYPIDCVLSVKYNRSFFSRFWQLLGL